MKKYIFMALSNPVPGREDEYNEWYTNTHLKEVCAVPGIIAAQRYVLSDEQVVGPGSAKVPCTGEKAKEASPWKYLAIYDFETESALETFKEMIHRLDIGVIAMPQPPVIREEGLAGMLYEAVTERMVAE